MTQILQATCINGNLVLSEKLSPEMEGKRLKVIVQEATETEQSEDYTAEQKFAAFIDHAKQYSAKLPANYKFNRDELYER
ncbi:MAG: hypothetical protein WCA07_15805 [Gloeobacterales cyanobacterium]